MNHCTKLYSYIHTKLLKNVTRLLLAHLSRIMYLKRHRSEKFPLSYQFGGRNSTPNFKTSYLKNLFSDMRSVSPWTVTYEFGGITVEFQMRNFIGQWASRYMYLVAPCSKVSIWKFRTWCDYFHSKLSTSGA